MNYKTLESGKDRACLPRGRKEECARVFTANAALTTKNDPNLSASKDASAEGLPPCLEGARAERVAHGGEERESTEQG